MQEFLLQVSSEEKGMRLDLFIAQLANKQGLGLSRTFIQGLIRKGQVTSRGLPVKRPHQKVAPGDEFKMVIIEKGIGEITPEDIPLDIIFEDDDLAVINKQAGVVHPAAGNYEHTLVNALLYHFKKLSDINPQRPGIVHRLDKETSGLLVIAKNNRSHLALAGQFARHSIERKYIAVVRGCVEFDENMIELPIGRHPIKRKNMSVGFGKNSKYARTHYRTLKRTKEYSLLELRPFTGRTHQLRVHLAFIGHPIMGDTKYGKDRKSDRLYLHAQYLAFRHPRTEKFVEFSCQVPKEFKDFLK
jgi:23S rRNA pseudouridine1911/1915/1917 synthase